VPDLRLRLAALGHQVRDAASYGPFRALRHPDFTRFASGQAVSLVGTWMQTIAEGWLVLTLTGSPFAVGLVTTFNTLPILIFTLYGGVVADRVDKRRYIMALQSVMLINASLLAYCTLSGVITVHLIWLFAFIGGLATAFEVPARQSYLVELVPADDLVSAAALNSTIYNLARVLGPAISGVLLAVAGPGACFAVNAISYVAVLIGLQRIRHRAVVERPAVRPSVFTGMQFIGARPTLAALTSQMMVVSVFAISFIPILPVYARDVLATDASGYGALTSAIGVGAALGAIIVGGLGRRVTRSRLASAGATVLALATIVLAGLGGITPAVICLAVVGAAMATNGIATATSLQLEATPEMRGRVMAVYSFVVLGLAPIGAFQAGWMAEQFGTRGAIAANGAVSLVGVLFFRRRLVQTSEG
jgi:MFS family permease